MVPIPGAADEQLRKQLLGRQISLLGRRNRIESADAGAGATQGAYMPSIEAWARNLRLQKLGGTREGILSAGVDVLVSKQFVFLAQVIGFGRP